MTLKLLPALGLVLGLAVHPANAADDAAIAKIDALYDQCAEIVADPASYWIGWRHDFYNGYVDNFQWYDRRDTDTPSVVLIDVLIDAIASEATTSCYRLDGTLAYIFTEMVSPNMADGGETGPAIARQGRLYFDASGKVISITSQIVDGEGTRLGDIDDEAYQLARGCSPVVANLTVDDVQTAYFHRLGEIDGSIPNYTPNQIDWCGELSAVQ
ncbi:MAG: hypothetical protein JWR75_753 [Devosia sp.]|nr:hypothetical protein [Devosia sp.]